MIDSGERQVAPTLEGIRRDHVARYQWAATRLAKGSRVVDVACGVGYGSKILAEAGCKVVAVDRDAEALAYARRHYAHPDVRHVRAEGQRLKLTGRFAAAVCFETIEHVADPLPLLRRLRELADVLLASVPNEKVLPYEGQAYHHRHYTPHEFKVLLETAGWEVEAWWGQEGPESEVESDLMGRTLIAAAKRPHAGKRVALGLDRTRAQAAPAHVAIVALGPSVDQYLGLAKRLGGRKAFCDEVWGINALGDVLACDRVFHMDDVRIQEIRAAADPKGNIAAMLPWLKQHPGPIYTSRPHPDYPGLVPFPIEAVLNGVPKGYMNSTAAYAVAYAVHIGVKKLTLFGMDFTYASAHKSEKGRACVEFWLGVAAARGIEIAMPKSSSLMDALEPQAHRFYGYDTLDLAIERKDGRITVGFTEKAKLATAEEIEARYDHSRHPNAIVEAGKP